MWHSEQIKFVNFKYDTWKLRILTEIKNLGRFGLKIAMRPNIYEIWHLVQIEHASYEYNTHHCLKRSRDD